MLPPAPEKSGFAPQQGMAPGATMSMQDVITQAAQREGAGDINAFWKKLASLMQDPNNKLIQFGDTVFLMKRVAPDTVEVHTFSSEPPQKMIEAFKAGARMLKGQGMKKAVTYADNPGYLKVAKATGLPVKVGQSAKVIKGQGKPVYTFTLDL
jgi:hypothetical protein